MKRVVIVGAGISGLAVAYRLRQQQPAVEITVLEQNSRPGGTVWTEDCDGFRIEAGPNGFLDSKPSTLNLCHELGLEGELVEASDTAARNRFLFLDGRLRQLPNSLRSFLQSDLLSWRAKLGLFAERFRRKRTDPADESVDAFARRRAGAEVAAIFADALVTGIHAGDPKLLSLRAAFPRMAALEAEHGSILKGLARTARQRRAEAKARGEPYRRPGKLWSLRPGLRRLIEALTERLDRPPVLGVTVRRLRREPAGWVVEGNGKEIWPADAVVLACPAYQQAAILADLDAALAERIGSIAYNRVAVVGLGYRRADVPHPLDGFGYIAPQNTRRDLLGVQWCSSTYPDRTPAGMVLLRALAGGWHRAEVAGWDDDRLLAAIRAELRLAMGITATPVLYHIVRWQRAIPQYHLGHLERVAAIQDRAAEHPGLFLGGNAYHGVALNDCTEQGDRIAGQAAHYLQGIPDSG
jgi:oxygen-dependent protoporphyrinogen oxidase